MGYVLKTALANKANYGNIRTVTSNFYIVWHYTANDGDSDEANAKYFQTAGRGASAHYFVDDDSVTQSVPDNYTAWSVGGSRYSNYKSTGGASLYGIAKNANTINIELCDTTKNGKYDVSQKTLDNAYALTKSLMKKYNIPISHVIRHFDVTGKSCPAWALTATAWANIKNHINGTTTTTAAQIATPTTSTTSSVNSYVKLGQQHSINFTGHGVKVDGLSGTETKEQMARVLQHAMNLDYKAGLVEDGDFGAKSIKALGSHYVKLGEKQYLVTALQIILLLKGKNCNVGCPGTFDANLQTALGGTICNATKFRELIS